jgi:hypothetical protein
MARGLFSLVMAALCAQALADEAAPVVLHAETSTFFRPGFRVDGKAETLVYKVVFYSEVEKRVVTLMSVNIKPTPKEWKAEEAAMVILLQRRLNPSASRSRHSLLSILGTASSLHTPELIMESKTANPDKRSILCKELKRK